MNRIKGKGAFRAVLAGTLSAAMLLSSGCGKPATETAKVAVITKAEGISYWEDVKKGAEDAGEEFGIDILYTVATKDNDYSTQEDAINRAVRDGAKAIIIAPNGKTELNEAFDRAKAKGIKIINLNTKADYLDIDSFIRCSDFDSGSVAARSAFETLEKNGGLNNLKNVAIVGHNTSTAEDRIAGFIETFIERTANYIAPTDVKENDSEKQKAAAIEAYKKGIIQGARCADAESAEKAATEILENPDNEISVMFATNTNTTLGVCKAVSTLKLENQITVIGFNSDADEITYIKNGVLDGTVVQNPYMQGYVGVRYAKKLIEGENVPVQLETGAVFVNQSNMNDDFVSRMLYPDGKPEDQAY